MAALVWTVKKVCYIIESSEFESVIAYIDYVALVNIVHSFTLFTFFCDKLNLCLI